MTGELAALLEHKRVCVCAGAGGVGKTTSAAAIALEMAGRGRRVAVLTIDPARRLSTPLCLPELGNEERRVDPERFTQAGIEVRGELWAMMLDAKRTWDDVIERHAPDAATRDAVLHNRIYQELSNAVAGSTEYMAMEKLYELYQSDRYDMLVLDTPPTRNALDFLDAPQRLTRFIDSRSLHVFLRPGRLGLRIVGRGGGVVFAGLKRITGIDLLRDLSDFFSSFGDMATGISERAERVAELLGSQETAFVVVSSPQRAAIDEAIFFHRRLRETGLPFGAAIVNRVHPGDPADREQLEPKLAKIIDERLARKVARNFEDQLRLAVRDQANIALLRREVNEEPIVRVPLLDDDVYDLEGLAAVNDHLFARRPALV
jgi:anion-transporting  ArsA/GET3 family ATPase